MRRWAPLLLVAALALQAGAAGFRKSPQDEARQAARDSLARTAVERPAATRSQGPAPSGLFLRSLVVPGWGQAVLARSRPEVKGRGRTGFLVDLGLAAGMWGLGRHAEIKAAESRSHAMRVAGAAAHGDNSDYWVDVSNYLSRADYNQAMLEANLPQRRYLDPAEDWDWGRREELIRYRDLRAMSERAQAQALATGGAIFINHVLSGVQALRLARQPGSAEVGVLPTPAGLALRVEFNLASLLR